MCRLRGASLLEAIVAALIFLIVFAAAMELLPRFSIREDDTVLLVEAEYRVSRTVEKYSTGVWPEGEYNQQYEWGEVLVQITRYRDFADVQWVYITARIKGSSRRIEHNMLIECRQ